MKTQNQGQFEQPSIAHNNSPGTSFPATVVRAAGLFICLIMASQAYAASVQVRVLDADSNLPVKGAAVCLGKASEGKEYGAHRTDGSGVANFKNVQDGALMITVSASQHKGINRQLLTRGVDVIRTINLPRGGLGPACDAPPMLISTNSSALQRSSNVLFVAGLKIEQGVEATNTRQVVLSPRISGQPTHYRASENPDFKGADWLKFEKAPVYTLSNGSGIKKVFFQIRKAVETEEGVIQKLSNVRSDRITLQ